jgi:tricorn protease
VGAAGQIYYLKASDGATSLQRYDLNTRKNETLLPAGQRLRRLGRRQEAAVPQRQCLVDRADEPAIEPAEGRIGGGRHRGPDRSARRVAQIFDEAWRINRDYFYAPNMHGVDWAAQREKYAAFLPHVATRADLNRVIQWMSSELASGITVGGGDSLSQPATCPGGLLGADYEMERPLPAEEGLRRPELEPAAARAA